MTAPKLNILLIAAEVAPFAKVGGLADVAGALPKALRALGHDVRIAMPCYRMIEADPNYVLSDLMPGFTVPVGNGVRERVFVKQTFLRVKPAGTGSPQPALSHPGLTSDAKSDPATETDPEVEDDASADAIPVYLIGNTPPDAVAGADRPAHPGYFQRALDSQTVYTLEPEPYIFFCRAVLEMLTRLEPEWSPDILHCNDWHTGLIPVFARQFYADTPAIAQAATVFTIHNLAYQGNFGREHWAATGLPETLATPEGLEFYGQWSFMKGALTTAERVNTVSETYAREIQTPEYGAGLEGLLQTLAGERRLSGIVNGIDYDTYNPADEPRLARNFSAQDPSGKIECKAALQTELGLPQEADTALIGLVSRLAEQKGLDLIAAMAERMLVLPVQFVLLGTGDPALEAYFRDLQARRPRQVRANITFDLNLAQRIYAGSDLFLMPSRFEPCGLGQLMSLRYGTIPIVRATGGLADTVQDFDPIARPQGNGFAFVEIKPEALLATVQRAVQTYQDKLLWPGLVARALRADFSWEPSATKYAALYEDARLARLAALR